MKFDLTQEPYHQLILLYKYFFEELYLPRYSRQKIDIKKIIDKMKSDFLLYKSFMVFANYVIDDILNINTTTEFLIYNVLYRAKVKNIKEINPLQFFIDEIFIHYNENLLHLFMLKLKDIYDELLSMEFLVEEENNTDFFQDNNYNNQDYFLKLNNKKKETLN